MRSGPCCAATCGRKLRIGGHISACNGSAYVSTDVVQVPMSRFYTRELIETQHRLALGLPPLEDKSSSPAPAPAPAPELVQHVAAPARPELAAAAGGSGRQHVQRLGLRRLLLRAAAAGVPDSVVDAAVDAAELGGGGLPTVKAALARLVLDAEPAAGSGCDPRRAAMTAMTATDIGPPRAC